MNLTYGELKEMVQSMLQIKEENVTGNVVGYQSPKFIKKVKSK